MVYINQVFTTDFLIAKFNDLYVIYLIILAISSFLKFFTWLLCYVTLLVTYGNSNLLVFAQDLFTCLLAK